MCYRCADTYSKTKDVMGTSFGSHLRVLLDVSRMSFGCRLDVFWMSFGCHLDVVCISFGCHVDVFGMLHLDVIGTCLDGAEAMKVTLSQSHPRWHMSRNGTTCTWDHIESPWVMYMSCVSFIVIIWMRSNMLWWMCWCGDRCRFRGHVGGPDPPPGEEGEIRRNLKKSELNMSKLNRLPNQEFVIRERLWEWETH